MRNKPFLLRNVFNKEEVVSLGDRISKSDESFDKIGFCEYVNTSLDNLSFGDRSSLIKKGLIEYLPTDYKMSLKILGESMGPEYPEKEFSGFDNFIYIPIGEYIAERGIDHPDISLNAIKELTKRFSMEFAIRPFIEKYPDLLIPILWAWSKDKNLHVRRLVSEGTRPRLPLGGRLRLTQKNPKIILDLLECLMLDPELYVRRSVANNLNDISKDNPDIVLNFVAKYINSESEDIKWIVRHGLRTLLRSGNKKALSYLGYSLCPELKLYGFNIKAKNIKIGDSLEFNFKLASDSKESQLLMIDYIIYFKMANGSNKAKIFKLSKKNIGAGEILDIRKKHSFKLMTTKKLYPGMHTLKLQINGEIYGSLDFRLI